MVIYLFQEINHYLNHKNVKYRITLLFSLNAYSLSWIIVNEKKTKTSTDIKLQISYDNFPELTVCPMTSKVSTNETGLVYSQNSNIYNMLRGGRKARFSR